MRFTSKDIEPTLELVSLFLLFLVSAALAWFLIFAVFGGGPTEIPPRSDPSYPRGYIPTSFMLVTGALALVIAGAVTAAIAKLR